MSSAKEVAKNSMLMQHVEKGIMTKPDLERIHLRKARGKGGGDFGMTTYMLRPTLATKM